MRGPVPPSPASPPAAAAPAGSPQAARAPRPRRNGSRSRSPAGLAGQTRRAGRSYLQQVLVHDLQATAAAHALAGGAARARGHGPRRGGGRQGGGGRAGVLVGRRGARLLRSARRPRSALAHPRGAPCRPVAVLPAPVGPHRGGSRQEPEFLRGPKWKGRTRGRRTGAGSGRPFASGTGAPLSPRRHPLPVRSPATPRTFSEGPPSAGRSLSSSLQTNIGSLFQYMALPYRIPARAARRLRGPRARSLLSAPARKKFCFQVGGPASLASPPAQNPPSEHGGSDISASEPAPGFGRGGKGRIQQQQNSNEKNPKDPPRLCSSFATACPPPSQSKERSELHLCISKEEKLDGKREYV